MLVWLGLFGLVASFHGIIIGYSRQIFALARAGYLPAVLGRSIRARHAAPRDPRRRRGRHRRDLQRLAWSIRRPDADGQHRTMSVFGAIAMYILSMASLFKLRRSQPPHGAAFQGADFPVFPAFALGAAVVCLATMVYFNPPRGRECSPASRRSAMATS